jgi:hypothetical protein
MSDPFEEFEFKPLTEGLGFHKKKSAAGGADTASTQMLSALDLEIPNLTSPLPRPETAKNETPKMPTTVVDDVLKNISQQRKLDFSAHVKEKVSLQIEKNKAPEYKNVVWSAGAFILDAMMILALSLVFTIDMLLVTRVDLIRNLTQPVIGNILFISLAAMLLAVITLYYTICRSFLGFTLGEWAFELQMGTDEERNSAYYPLKVTARSLLSLVTGFVLLPVISVIVRTDLAGRLTQTRLTKKV